MGCKDSCPINGIYFKKTGKPLRSLRLCGDYFLIRRMRAVTAVRGYPGDGVPASGSRFLPALAAL
jgi:hypothetical protein